jgi:hypothetical protein
LAREEPQRYPSELATVGLPITDEEDASKVHHGTAALEARSEEAARWSSTQPDRRSCSTPGMLMVSGTWRAARKDTAT